jgi:heme exporter protein D
MTHTGYILAAYLITAVVLFGLAAWVAVDLRAQRAKLERLDAQGVRRRSDRQR